MDVTSIVLSKSTVSGLTSVATFSVDNALYSDSYILKKIDGLDADDIQPQLYGKSANSSAKYFNMRLKSRDIVLQIILNPNYSAGQTPGVLRDTLYRTISAYRTSMLDIGFFLNATELAQISGYVTKFETDLNSQTPTVKITLNCPYPYLRSRNRVIQNMSGISTVTPTFTDNVSSAPHGLRMTLTWTGSGVQPVWRHIDNDWFFQIKYVFTTNDVLQLSTEEDNKYVFVQRAGVTTNLAANIAAGSVWPIIFPGANQWLVTSSNYTFTSVDFYTTYWGV